jgi:hypothetical protein
MRRKDHSLYARLFASVIVGPVLLMQACSSGTSNSSSSSPITKTIAHIQVVGPPVIVFDHTTDQQQPYNIPDEQITAWKEANGTVNLMIPHYEAYRMRGTYTMNPDCTGTFSLLLTDLGLRALVHFGWRRRESTNP